MEGMISIQYPVSEESQKSSAVNWIDRKEKKASFIAP